jgi:urea transport system substrate-binding protein
VLGHFRVVHPGRRIVIEHDQPWRGQLHVTFNALNLNQTRVRVRAEVPIEGAHWLAEHRGARLPLPPPTAARRVGLLTSKSGSGAIYAVAAEYMAQLAVEEANTSGGVSDRSVEVLVADDATDHIQAKRETTRLIEAGCHAIFACVTSASFGAAVEAARHHDVLMVHPVINEGGMQGDKVIRFGERPSAQIDALAKLAERSAGGNRWFLVGQQYSWSWGANRAAQQVLDRSGGNVVAKRYTPLGTRDFTSIIESIRASGTDIVMSSLVGADEVAFQQQAHDAGLQDFASRVSLVMDESTLEHVGIDAGRGIWAALNYFQSAATNTRGISTMYRERFGPWAPPLSSLSINIYESVRQYLQLAALHPDSSATALARLWRERRTKSSVVGERDLAHQRLYLAQCGDAGLRVIDSAG